MRYGEYSRQARPGLRKGKIYRPFLFVLVLLLACSAFWSNSKNRFEHIAMQGLFDDQTGLVTPEQREAALSLIKNFKQDFGVPMEVRILKRPPASVHLFSPARAPCCRGGILPGI